jgi:hypothetical protein
MLVLYGQCDESATVAAQEYAVRFPNREHPSRQSLAEILKFNCHLSANGAIGPKKTGHNNPQTWWIKMIGGNCTRRD